jgi:hypothetical protein
LHDINLLGNDIYRIKYTNKGIKIVWSFVYTANIPLHISTIVMFVHVMLLKCRLPFTKLERNYVYSFCIRWATIRRRSDCGIWIYNYLCNQWISPLKLWVRISLMARCLDTTLCDKVCQWLARDRLFSPGISVSSTNKSYSHDTTQILLKVLLYTITLTHQMNLQCQYNIYIYMIDSDQRPFSNRRPLLKSVSTDVIISNHGPIWWYSQIGVLSKFSEL